jgi:citrate lyase subunit beta/citryl-CoA lyase
MVASEEQVRYADNVLTYAERIGGLSEQTDLIVLPESAYGLYNPYELCACSERVASIVGATTDKGDFNRVLGYEHTTKGLESLFVRSNVLAAARAAGLKEILSGIWTAIDDIDGLRQQASFARQLGYTGYLVVHPDHVPVVNEIFTPDREEIKVLQEMVTEIERAASDGKGVIRHNGQMVDEAHVETAKQRIDRAVRLGVI